MDSILAGAKSRWLDERMKKPKRDAQIDVGAPDYPDLLP
jgi:hypothetical protein